MNLRIVIRTDTPWSTMTIAQFCAQREPHTPTEFSRVGKNILPIWEQATGRDFFRYRDYVKRLAHAKLVELGLPITVGIPSVDWDSPDEFLIPIDDDDALFSSVKSIINHIDASVNLVIWQRLTNYLGHQRLEEPVIGSQLDTCNWAIRKSFLNQFSLSDRIHILSRHWHAAGILAPKFGGRETPKDLLSRAKKCLTVRRYELKHPSIVVLHECHSVYYLHSASISFLVYKHREHGERFGDVIRTLPLHPLVQYAQH